LAEFKAEVLNEFVEEHGISSVIEYGCGDGNQLTLARYRSYLGFDISPEALELCESLFREDPTKTFRQMDDYTGERAELTLSLDVVYHLVEDPVFESYMRRLFDSSTRYVIVYSSNRDEQDAGQPPHVRHRSFTRFVEEHVPGWKLQLHIPNRYPGSGDTRASSFADFFIYQRD
jgi:SAM-dependent methyltransferase